MLPVVRGHSHARHVPQPALADHDVPADAHVEVVRRDVVDEVPSVDRGRQGLDVIVARHRSSLSSPDRLPDDTRRGMRDTTFRGVDPGQHRRGSAARSAPARADHRARARCRPARPRGRLPGAARCRAHRERQLHRQRRRRRRDAGHAARVRARRRDRRALGRDRRAIPSSSRSRSASTTASTARPATAAISARPSGHTTTGRAPRTSASCRAVRTGRRGARPRPAACRARRPAPRARRARDLAMPRGLRRAERVDGARVGVHPPVRGGRACASSSRARRSRRLGRSARGAGHPALDRPVLREEPGAHAAQRGSRSATSACSTAGRAPPTVPSPGATRRGRSPAQVVRDGPPVHPRRAARRPGVALGPDQGHGRRAEASSGMSTSPGRTSLLVRARRQRRDRRSGGRARCSTVAACGARCPAGSGAHPPRHRPDGRPGRERRVVNALQRHASIVVQKSLAEGFGLTVAEAMWKSRPVVASAVGGSSTRSIDGETGSSSATRATSRASARPWSVCCASRWGRAPRPECTTRGARLPRRPAPHRVRRADRGPARRRVAAAPGNGVASRPRAGARRTERGRTCDHEAYEVEGVLTGQLVVTGFAISLALDAI